jgi:hypothetical protein
MRELCNLNLKMFPESCFYVFQPKAWMDEKIGNQLIDNLVITWNNKWDQSIALLPILDTYHVHMMGRIENQINTLGIRH